MKCCYRDTETSAMEVQRKEKVTAWKIQARLHRGNKLWIGRETRRTLLLEELKKKRIWSMHFVRAFWETILWTLLNTVSTTDS